MQTVSFKLDGLHRLRKIVASADNRVAAAPLERMFKKWTQIYSSFVRRRFKTNSRGGGDWPDLKAATVQRRRKGRRRKGGKFGGAGVRKTSIMYDTGTLYRALVVGAPGNQTQRVPHGVRYGFGSGARHPKGGTIAEIAVAHHTGAGHLPVRRILHVPDGQTAAGMMRAAKQAVREIEGIVGHA